MADPASYRPAPGSIPTNPGVYTFRDADDRVLYVGKAKNLRARLSNYFQDPAHLEPRIRTMVHTADHVQWTVVGSELEALNLEYTWIKKFAPRFNVMYRDDKTYPMLAVSVKEQFPRAFLYRGPRKKGVRYFGPYPKAWAIRDTLESLTRVFPVRTCTAGVYRRHEQLGRPCLLGYIDRCSAPCVGRVSPSEHMELVDGLCSFLAGGNTERVMREVRHDMQSAAENLDFERAASLRDQLGAMEKAMEKQAVVFSDDTDADVVAVDSDDLEAAVQIFHVRGGRIRGQRGWVVERQASSEDGSGDSSASGSAALSVLLEDFLTQFYGDTAALDSATESAVGGNSRATDGVTLEPVPREILVPELPADAPRLTEWLEDLRGGKVRLRVPQRGDKKALMDTATANASQALAQHKIARAGDLTTRSAALRDLQEALWMEDSPLRIECTDISHIQGTDVVASLVVFEDGLPRKSDYRRYRIREAAGDGHSDDVASIAEVVRRRFRRHGQDRLVVPAGDDGGDLLDGEVTVEQAEASSKKFAYPPQLFIVDGGKPQVNAAQEVLDELGVTDVTLVGVAKRLEELWVPGDEYPVILPRNSQALYLIQQIRDEAHRFAITFHRASRGRRMTRSALDDVRGLGPTRRAQLVKAFGSVAKVREAGVEGIAELPGFGLTLAEAVMQALTPQEPDQESG
ncbi:MAG: excinuclease ABC subunit UvrC [Corynebacterium sp.]|uniref:excinuclease ABC subunit UvrC n=2 Tax=Corynebacterium sp. TaxID=1720 RepID=UPI0026473419|nr:excinuclease ABC subunit UvrC [Corynebacterium sp.]MDN6282482.1 excinuclease ABC subunit UvrC [Corynebacterium sp.]MDN6305097.1 excinuclease ABC subunit UvrC [Corynebacterium sp.]MDN6366635.1 excinuclease ABC subunit UvrC [Corynebacterium sp.]MDN6374740.1 excinuclease ABC subunit UvrC [Corynebacterium sp.]MDN6395491.1 excinuclease ABC subunit UvrC [Corynebacterium sp.]